MVKGMRKKILVKEEYCIGCRLCEIYCVTAHSQSKNLIRVFRYELGELAPAVIVEEREYTTFAVQCRHCEEASCVRACITGAMHRDSSTGAVYVDRDKCVGCWMCIMVCPYGVIKRGTGSNKVASKCDLCLDRELPACVENCPNEALVLTEVNE
ncbi:MAG: anaerobic carbon-monoxide dehydrogenase iron sulfur subunit [Thermotogota bacterium]|nr:anaerobic carbon-monoxide dehydrogenase iron sulfur subunit [Thermotogota bacterium]MDK2864420.1 anaerobic carbon-monoxide dehydrogenase iron sulfur subunit [Thermotogota bacterium]HCZ07429.1 4Fe-4S ferredoxin [Thermotogota bacterium]